MKSNVADCQNVTTLNVCKLINGERKQQELHR